jgi:hypothetical protein
MKQRGWARPSPSLVLSLLTLFIALTTTAVALPGRNLVEKGDIAKGAVTARDLARGSVKARAIRKKAVTSRKLANHAVTARSLAASSVGAFALGDTTTVSAPIPDVDAIPDDVWTTSATAVAVCPPGSALLGGGVAIASSSRHRAFVQTSSPNGNRWEGTISTDTAGASPGQVYAVCLL